MLQCDRKDVQLRCSICTPRDVTCAILFFEPAVLYMEVLCEVLSSPSRSSSPSRVSFVQNRCRNSISVSSVFCHLEPAQPGGESFGTWNLWFCILASQASFRHRKCRKHIGNSWAYLPKPNCKQARVPRYIDKLSGPRSHLEPHPIQWQTILLTEHRSWQTAVQSNTSRSLTILETKPLFGRVLETSLCAHDFR